MSDKPSAATDPPDTPNSAKSTSTKRPTRERIIKTLNEFGCDITVSADKLGIAPTTLRDRILKDKKLRALFSEQAALPLPDEVDTMVRERSPDIPEGKLIQAIHVNNQELDNLTDGLERNGIDSAVIAKLKSLGGFEHSAGKFLVGSLDLAQRLVTFSTVALFEKAEHIDNVYLKNNSVSPKDKLAWQRMYNQCVDQMFKGYSNILSGTLPMSKMLSHSGKNDDKKPGFQPLPGDEQK